MDDAYLAKRRIIQTELDAASSVYITTDTWTSVNVDNIVSVTCHYINKDFELNRHTLQTEKITGSHTAHALSQTLTNIFCQWNIKGKVKCAVTDNAAHMLAAVRNLNSVSTVSCLAHYFKFSCKNIFSSHYRFSNHPQKMSQYSVLFQIKLPSERHITRNAKYFQNSAT